MFSHIAYESKTFQVNNNQQNINLDTILLNPTVTDLSTVTISGKRSKKWKKHLKNFKRELLGRSEFGTKSEILNPSALRFEEKGEIVECYAIEPLRILNQELGYHIDYWFEYMRYREKWIEGYQITFNSGEASRK